MTLVIGADVPLDIDVVFVRRSVDVLTREVVWFIAVEDRPFA